MGWNYLSIPKLQRCNRWSLGMDKSFHPTLYQACNYLSMLWLKLNHVSKWGHWCRIFALVNCIWETGPALVQIMAGCLFGTKPLSKSSWLIVNCTLGNKLKWNSNKNKANLRDLITATGLVIFTQIGFKSSIFQPVWPWNLVDDSKKQ